MPRIPDKLAPLVAPLKTRLFPGSGAYWQARYDKGDNSGAGSYGAVAQFKAQVLNAFVAENGVESVIEFGSGDGNQLALANYPSYLGLDVATGAIDLCRARFGADSSKSFYLYSTPHFIDHARVFHADLALSLDVLFHLVEDEVFDGYMRHLFAAADRFVGIFATNDETIPDRGAHVRHRTYTRWVEQHAPGWTLMQHVPNALNSSDSIADFRFFAKS